MITKIWKTKDGRKIKIKDMTDSHLLNTMRFLERAFANLQANMPYPSFNGEMAQYYAEQEWDRFQSRGPEYSYPIYEDLKIEAYKRKLIK